MKKTLLRLLVVVGTVFLGTGGAFHLQAKEFPYCESFGVQRPREKREAIPFSLKDLNGKQISLGDYRGKPVLLFFWGTWCESCKEDIVLLEKFFADKPGQLEILTVVIDGQKENRVKKAVKKYKLTVPVLLDNNEKLARMYGVKLIPTTFLINRDGFLEGMIVGQRGWCEPMASKAVRELLGIY
jgi:peroxiredoxin